MGSVRIGPRAHDQNPLEAFRATMKVALRVTVKVTTKVSTKLQGLGLRTDKTIQNNPVQVSYNPV